MKTLKSFSLLAIASALLMAGSFTACDDSDDAAPVNDGKIDPSTIATANLVAYFPFESAAASISKGEGITYSKTGGAGSFAVGRRGNGYKGSTAEAYLEYNVAATNVFTSMSEFSMGAWIKSPAAGGAAKIFGLSGGDSFMGNLVFMLEGNSNVDSLDLKGYLFNSTTEWKGQDLRVQNKAFLTDKWVHIVYSYNKTTSTMALYANGLLVRDGIKYAGPGTPPTQPLLGAVTFGNTTLLPMNKINIGAWPQQLDGTGQDWMKFYPGLLDELRIYNKALTDVEIKALYDAEITQVNL